MSGSPNKLLLEYIVSSRGNYVYPSGMLPSNFFFRNIKNNSYFVVNVPETNEIGENRKPIIYETNDMETKEKNPEIPIIYETNDMEKKEKNPGRKKTTRKKKNCNDSNIMSNCQIGWNFKDYKTMEQKGEDIELTVVSAPITFSNLENNSLFGLYGNLVLTITKKNMEDKDNIQENYNITYSTDNKVIGSLFIVTDYIQPNSDGFQTLLSNVIGTISCKGVFSDFHNGTAIIEYNNDTGERCLTVYKKSSIETCSISQPKKICFKIETPSYNSPDVLEQTVRSDNSTNNPPIWALTQIRKITVTEDKYNIFTEEQKQNAKLLTSLTGNGIMTDKLPPLQSGSYMLVFDDFTSIVFNTGFNSNFGFGLYIYTGLVNNIKEYKTSKIYWNAISSDSIGSDTWEIFLE